MSDKTVFEKQNALSKWLGKDISTWSSKRIHAVYSQESRKRIRSFSSEFLPKNDSTKILSDSIEK